MQKAPDEELRDALRVGDGHEALDVQTAIRLRRQLAQQFREQLTAVKIAAHHLNKRGGLLLGDVVGLGKTMMATAIARVFDDDFGLDALTLVICSLGLRGDVP
jgi:MoxR-like ATPase